VKVYLLAGCDERKGSANYLTVRELCYLRRMNYVTTTAASGFAEQYTSITCKSQ